MANSTAGKIKTANTAPEVNAMSVVAPALGWLIPGAGHIIQRRWIRGLLLLVSILVLGVAVAILWISVVRNPAKAYEEQVDQNVLKTVGFNETRRSKLSDGLDCTPSANAPSSENSAGGSDQFRMSVQ